MTAHPVMTRKVREPKSSAHFYVFRLLFLSADIYTFHREGNGGTEA